MVVPTSGVVVDNSGASAVTVTASCSPPTARAASSVTICVRPTVIFSWCRLVNPSSVNVTL